MEVPYKFKEEVGDESDEDDESGKINEAFICCICRDLLYKPVVLEEENKTGYFSPQINGSDYVSSQSEETRINPSDAFQPCISDAEPSLGLCPVRAGGAAERIEPVQYRSGCQDMGLLNLLDRRKDIITPTNDTTSEDRNSNEVSVDDVLCASCKRMLFRPIVLNCGHAFCVCCIGLETNEMLKCEVCQSPHPGDIPKVCLEFDHFLEEQFPKEYGLRRATLQMKQEEFPSETRSSSEADKGNFHFSFTSGDDPLPLWDSSSKVHIGVGCDSCGMYPIIGDRYRCRDCSEQVGYDLCVDCYTTSSKLPGRFNQQHTSEHTFEILKSDVMHNIMLRLIRGQLEEASSVSAALNDGLFNMIPSSENADQDSQNADDAPPPSSDTNQMQ